MGWSWYLRGKHGDIGGEGVDSRGRQTLPGLSYAEYGNILNICLVMALDLFLTILFVILIRLLIAESFRTTYSIISSTEWWENILNIARKWWLH